MIYVVGLGPGHGGMRTADAAYALARADIIVGYNVYVDLIRQEFPEKEFYENGMRGEVERCREALCFSRTGRTVAVVCSGDASIYGMASLVLELSEEQDEVVIVPGVTAALAASAALGAPLAGDMAIVSLSDLLTPWETIQKRLEAAAMGDFPIALYNPASKKRTDYLARASSILLARLPGSTPCGWVRNIAREGQAQGVTTLGKLAELPADMFTTVIVGNSETVERNGRLLTPRGYRK